MRFLVSRANIGQLYCGVPYALDYFAFLILLRPFGTGTGTRLVHLRGFRKEKETSGILGILEVLLWVTTLPGQKRLFLIIPRAQPAAHSLKIPPTSRYT